MIGHAAILAGVLFAVATYLLLSRRTQDVVMGFLILSNAANLLVLTAGGLPSGAAPPIITDGSRVYSDPLPHAFLLTAIVIGLAAAAFLMALGIRTDANKADPRRDPGQSP